MSATGNSLRGWDRLKDPYWSDKARIGLTHDLVREVSESEPEIGQLQSIHTPFDLCNEIVDQLENVCNIQNANIAVLFNLEFVTCLIEREVKPGQITFFGDSKHKRKHAKLWYNIESNKIGYDPTQKDSERVIMPIKKQFDVVIMNPPYQAPKSKNPEGQGKSGASLWDKFIELAINNLLKEGGRLCSINPSRWRKPKDKTGELMRNKQLEYLEIHGLQDGLRTFNCETRYDWFVLKNSNPKSETVVVDEQGVNRKVLFTHLPFVPNFDFERVINLIAKDGEEKVEVLHSYSDYETRKPWMSNEKKGKFRHPCVYSIKKSGEVTYFYSSKKEGHFGVPKVIFPSGRYQSVGLLVDANGDFGLTQYARGIVDSPRNLPAIARALSSDEFVEFYKAFAMATTELDKDIIRCFRKDFWKEFI